MEPNFSLAGKVIVVTGGTGVLGGAFVDGIAAAGGIVGILGRNEKIANERANAINQKGGQALALIADVTNESQLEAACQQMLTAFGKIDGLVNAAGGNIPNAVVQPDQDVFELNFQALQEVMQLNLMGTVMPTQVFGKAIKKNGSGSIVNISSVVSQLAITKVLGYSLAKSAIDSYTQWFAVELAKRFGDAIRMNSIAPGFFLTEQNKTLLTNTDGSLTERGQLVIQNTPFKRFGNPEELVGALIWLLSDASKYVTGSKITVDGGFTVFGGV
ncbi:dioxygenase [Flavobacterium ammoniigenes]|uniref:Dioxygenase n=1 Tax=Flavobacterium ammoniigenes TaxID=1751095 RepID=A0ABM7V3H9_9FLAO|nr:SDR family oxidoreductase [Flavobacterium ammoniigenes]BDB54067.1 dioxygenase [Flavobacterium ammoniigenes]